MTTIFERRLRSERACSTSPARLGVQQMDAAMSLFHRALTRHPRIESLAAHFQSTQPGSSDRLTSGLALRRLLIDQLCDVANAERDIQDARRHLTGPQALTASQIQQQMGVLVRDAGEDLAAVNRLLGLAVDDVQLR